MEFGFPFYFDSYKKQEYNLVNFDTQGNYQLDTVYGNHNSLIYHYDKWYISKNGEYKRNYKVYKINNINIENVYKLFSNSNNIKEILDNPIIEGTQIKGELISKDELNMNEYLEAFIYIPKNNNYIIVKEPIIDNFVTTLVYILLNLKVDYQFTNYKEKKKELIN